MNLIVSLFVSALLINALWSEEPKHSPHASREQALALLRREGILHDKDRVTYSSWTGEFWILSLRRPDGHESNWSVDRYAREAGYICKH